MKSSIFEEWYHEAVAAGIAQGTLTGLAQSKAVVAGKLRNMIYELLTHKFSKDQVAPLHNEVDSQNDLDCLSQWFKYALHSNSVAEFQAAIQALNKDIIINYN